MNSSDLGVSVGPATTTERLDDVNEAPVVLHATLGAAGLLLFLLLLVNLLVLELVKRGLKMIVRVQGKN